MKRTVALCVALVLLLSMLCSCGEKSSSFDFTVDSFVEGFNTANTELDDIDETALTEVEYTEDSLFIEYKFDDYVRFCAYVDPDTRIVQKMFMWLEPEGIEDKTNAYKFASYNAIMLSSLVDSQEEYEKIIETLALDQSLEYNTDTLYSGDDFAAYYIYDSFGYRLLIVTPAEMEELEAEAAKVAEQDAAAQSTVSE